MLSFGQFSYREAGKEREKQRSEVMCKRCYIIRQVPVLAKKRSVCVLDSQQSEYLPFLLHFRGSN